MHTVCCDCCCSTAAAAAYTFFSGSLRVISVHFCWFRLPTYCWSNNDCCSPFVSFHFVWFRFSSVPLAIVYPTKSGAKKKHTKIASSSCCCCCINLFCCCRFSFESILLSKNDWGGLGCAGTEILSLCVAAMNIISLFVVKVGCRSDYLWKPRVIFGQLLKYYWGQATQLQVAMKSGRARGRERARLEQDYLHECTAH